MTLEIGSYHSERSKGSKITIIKTYSISEETIDFAGMLSFYGRVYEIGDYKVKLKDIEHWVKLDE